MWIDPTSGLGLTNTLLDALASQDGASRLSVTLLENNTLAVGYGPPPIPIASSKRNSGVSQPELYLWFLLLTTGVHSGTLTALAPVLNALTSRLAVLTRHGDESFRATFSRGHLVTLLSSKWVPPEEDWTNRLVFTPDPEILDPDTVELGAVEALATALREEHPGVEIAVTDRSDEQFDWL